MDNNLVKLIQEKMEIKKDEELLNIWEENNRDTYSEEAYEAIKQILLARNILLPKQKDFINVEKEELNKIAFPPIEVRNVDGQIFNFTNLESFRQAILDRKLCRTQEARLLIDEKKASKKEKWVSVEKLANNNFSTQVLYRPIWAYTMRVMMICWYIGFILKAIDGAIGLYLSNEPEACLLFSIGAGALIVGLLTRIQWIGSVYVIVLIYSIFKGVFNLGFVILAVGLVSFLLAAPFGMIIGSLIGHFRRRFHNRAFDALPEGAKPYLLGILVPLVFAAVFIPLYLLYLNPMLMEWSSK